MTMVTIADLSPYDSHRPDLPLLAVGWLGRSADYPTGAVPSAFFEKLTTLCQKPWRPAVAVGVHRCELCQFSPPMFTAEAYIPGEGCLYVAPVGILHYIAAHWYRPPDVFLEAVLTCPPMRSLDYMRKVRANGGRNLIEANRR